MKTIMRAAQEIMKIRVMDEEGYKRMAMRVPLASKILTKLRQVVINLIRKMMEPQTLERLKARKKKRRRRKRV